MICFLPKPPHTDGVMGGCIVMVKEPRVVTSRCSPDELFHGDEREPAGRSADSLFHPHAQIHDEFVVEGRPDLGSSSTSLRPLLKRLCHSKTRVLDITS